MVALRLMQAKYILLSVFFTDTDTSFAEDSWRFVRIGDDNDGQGLCSTFRNVALCPRCIFTTVDPLTADKDSRGEPLKTLRTFRCVV